MPDTVSPTNHVADSPVQLDAFAEPDSCLSIFDATKNLRVRYRRLALVSHARHLSELDKEDNETLIVSSDWLVWQTAAAEGYNITIADVGLLAWTGPDIFSAEAMVRANDWVYVDGQDVTKFRGVSLGKQIVRPMTVFVISFVRLTRALSALIETYQPEELILFDYRSDFNALDPEMRRYLVSTVAKDAGIGIVDQWAPVDPNDPFLPLAPERLLETASETTVKSISKRMILFVYSHAVDTISRILQKLDNHKNRVLVIVNTNIGDPLMNAFCGRRIFPVFIFRTQRKNFSLVFERLRRGILLAGRPDDSLDSDQVRQLDSIVSQLEQAWRSSKDGLEEAVRRHVRDNVIESGRMAAIAREVNAAVGILDRYRPSRMLTDSVINPPPRIFVELAHLRGIPVDYTWHSVIPPVVQNWDALGGDPRCPAMVSRILSWGPLHDRWCAWNSPEIERVRSGTPIQDHYVSRRGGSGQSRPRANALVLEYTIGSSDVFAVHSVRFEYFVRIVSMLEDLGYTNIRFKLHPGRPKTAYYEAIRDRFGLRCTIHKTEPFETMLDVADFVVGPPTTGARFEALGAKKPYFAVVLPPCSYDVDSMRDEPVYVGFDALRRAITEMAPQDNDDLLNTYCSTIDVPNPARRIWEILADGEPEPDA